MHVCYLALSVLASQPDRLPSPLGWAEGTRPVGPPNDNNSISISVSSNGSGNTTIFKSWVLTRAEYSTLSIHIYAMSLFPSCFSRPARLRRGQTGMSAPPLIVSAPPLIVSAPSLIVSVAPLAVSAPPLAGITHRLLSILLKGH